MGKGDLTKQNILNQAVRMASQMGLEGLSIGTLAEKLSLSKSGLFAHFRSKEALQKQVIETTAARFTEFVVRPALTAPRGIPRLRALFERWLAWGSSEVLPGGCPFIAAAAELDDKPGPVRDHLVKVQREWLETRARIVKTAIDEGHFRANVDPAQMAHDLFAIMLGYHYSSRLLRDGMAEKKTRNAFERLLAEAATHNPRKA